MKLEDITPDSVEQLLRQWQQRQQTPPQWRELNYLLQFPGSDDDERLLAFREWVSNEVIRELQSARRRFGRQAHEPADSLETINQHIRADFVAPVEYASTDGDLLRAWSALYYRYLEDQFELSVAALQAASGSDANFFRRKVEKGLALLAEKIRRQEYKSRHKVRGVQQVRRSGIDLPEQLIGSTMLQQQVVEMLKQPNAPQFSSIEGIGGIGKTALAYAVIRQLEDLQQYEGMYWITAQQYWFNANSIVTTNREQETANAARSMREILMQLADHLACLNTQAQSVNDLKSALAPRLAKQNALIVIDNLETVSDLELLLPILQEIAGKARFLLTTRHSLREYGMVEAFSVPMLSSADSSDLLKREIRRQNKQVALPNLEQLNEIHTLIGGIPLAIKLVASQLVDLPHEHVIANLRLAHGNDSTRLFNYIYRHSWELLHEESRQMLLALCDSIGNGAEWEWVESLGESSGLSTAQIEHSLRELIAYSLLEVKHLKRRRIYQMHRLTQTFLKTDLLNTDWNTATLTHDD